MVSCSTQHKKSDLSCILTPSDHRFLKTNSVMMYRYCRRETTQRMQELVKGKVFIPHEPVARPIIDKIVSGAKVSDFSPPWLLRMLSEIY